jgi:hypothetical protein
MGRGSFGNMLIRALAYEVIGFVILFVIAYFWYGHFLKTSEFIAVSFVVAVVYYVAFHWIFGVENCT